MSISSAFVKAANSAGATAKEKFSQGKLLKGEPSASARKGICGGLSLTFLGLYAKSGFKSLTDAQAHSWPALLEFGLKLQNQLTEVSGGATTVAQALMINFCKAAPIVGLKGDGLVFSKPWPCAGDIARKVTGAAGFYIIALPNHYVAAAYDGEGKGVFFDPNAGAAEFDGVHSFTAMLTYYFTNPEVTTAYECSGDTIYVLPLSA